MVTAWPWSHRQRSAPRWLWRKPHGREVLASTRDFLRTSCPAICPTTGLTNPKDPKASQNRSQVHFRIFDQQVCQFLIVSLSRALGPNLGPTFLSKRILQKLHHPKSICGFFPCFVLGEFWPIPFSTRISRVLGMRISDLQQSHAITTCIENIKHLGCWNLHLLKSCGPENACRLNDFFGQKKHMQPWRIWMFYLEFPSKHNALKSQKSIGERWLKIVKGIYCIYNNIITHINSWSPTLAITAISCPRRSKNRRDLAQAQLRGCPHQPGDVTQISADHYYLIGVAGNKP